MSQTKGNRRSYYAPPTNEAPTRLKRALWRWAEEQGHLKLGPKALLNHLADHADEEGRVFIFGRHFRKLMNISPRTLTNYIRKLEAEGLIFDIGQKRVIPSAQLALYRLAPDDAAISMLLVQAREKQPDWSGNADTRPGKDSDRLGNISCTYKDNSKDSSLTLQAARPGDGNAAPRDWEDLQPVHLAMSAEVVDDFRSSFGEGAYRQYLKHALWSERHQVVIPKDAHTERWLLDKAEQFFLERGADVASSGLAACYG